MVLLIALAVLAALPLLQFLSLGYLLEASGRVVLHRDLDGGVARQALGGGLEIWVPSTAGATHAIIRWRAGAWQVTTAQTVTADAVATNSGNF